MIWICIYSNSATANSNTPENVQEIYEMLKFLDDISYDNGIFTGESIRHKYASMNPIDEKELEIRLSEREDELWEKLKQGKLLSKTYDEELKMRGIASYEEALKNPTYRGHAEQIIAKSLETYKQYLISKDQEALDQQAFELYISSTRQYYKKEWEGIDGVHKNSPQEIKVYNEGTRKSLRPGEKIGTIRKGMEYFDSAISILNPMTAHKPNLLPIYTSDSIQSINQESSPEGTATKIVLYNRSEGGGGFMQILWMLPDKGNRIYRREHYLDGKLRETWEYREFQETENGIWYPHEQIYNRIHATLPKEVEDKLKNGTLPVYSEEVLKSQLIQKREETTLNITNASINTSIEQNIFELEFPYGTEVYDFSQLDESGKPLTFTVGRGVANEDGIYDEENTLETININQPTVQVSHGQSQVVNGRVSEPVLQNEAVQGELTTTTDQHLQNTKSQWKTIIYLFIAMAVISPVAIYKIYIKCKKLNTRPL